MKSKKLIALFTSSLLASNIVCPVYATDTTNFEDIDISEEDIENEQKKDEEFDEEYGLEDSDTDGDSFIDDQDKHYCCKCHCCIEDPDPEEDEAELICEDCSAQLTKEKAEANAKELADMISDFKSLKTDERFEFVTPSNREELKNGDVMMLADALYIYVYLSDEIYTWYKVTDNGLEETPNLRFSEYAEYYRVIKNVPAYSIPEYLTATQGTELSKVVLPHGFEWQETDIILDELGNKSFLASYTPDNLILFKKVSNIKINVLVKKKTLDVVYPDGRYMLNYTPGLTLEAVPLPDGWSFEKPKKDLDVGSEIYTVYFTKDDEYDYNQSTEPVQIRVDVEKASMFVDDIYIEVPAGTILTDNLLPKINDGILEWDVAEKIATISSVYTCHFSPNDTDRYCMTKDIAVHVTVKSSSAVEDPTKSEEPIVSTNPSEKPSVAPSEEPSEEPIESEKPSEKPLEPSNAPEQSQKPDESSKPDESTKPNESESPSIKPSVQPSPSPSKDPDKTFKPLTPVDKYEFVDKEDNMLDITSISKLPTLPVSGNNTETKNEIYTSNGEQSNVKPSNKPEENEDIDNNGKDDGKDDNSNLITSTSSPKPTNSPIITTTSTPKPNTSTKPTHTPTHTPTQKPNPTVKPTKSPTNNGSTVVTHKPNNNSGSLTINSGNNSNKNNTNNNNNGSNTVSLNNITIGSSNRNKTPSANNNGNSFTVVSTANRNTNSLSTSGTKNKTSNTTTATKTSKPNTVVTTTTKKSPSPNPSTSPSTKPNSLSSITIGQSTNPNDEKDPTTTVTSSTETTGKNQLTVVLPTASPASESGETNTESNNHFAGLSQVINNETVPTNDKPTLDEDLDDETEEDEDDTEKDDEENEDDKNKDDEKDGEKKGISIKVIIPIVIIVVAIGALIFIKRR